MKKNLLAPLLIITCLTVATIIIVLYGKGYRLGLKQDLPQISKTGLLVANSTPNGAQVFIDGHLTTATDNTLSLPPGIYSVKIQKEGFFPWEKKLKVTETLVTEADTRLFPVAPKLESIASSPVLNPTLDPSGTKIAFQIASDSAIKKNGIYILNMNASTPVSIITLQSSSTQIVDDTQANFSQAKLKWSPDGTQIIAEIASDNQTKTTYLLLSNRFNDNPQDITAIKETIYQNWKEQKLENDSRINSGLTAKIRKLIKENFSIISWSPDNSKVIYQASSSAEIPLIIKPRRLGLNTMVENRKLNKGDIFLYDTKEDFNLKLPISPKTTCTDIDKNEPYAYCHPNISWLPNSNHLIYTNDKKIIIMDEDGSNQITIYAGPFADNFTTPWSDGSKLVILTNLGNPSVSPTLYTISLK